MSSSLDILKEIGANSIHKTTHISKEYIQAIIHENFDGISSIQFSGFISIVEREYNVDLSELRAKGDAHFKELKGENPERKKIFVIPKRKKSYVKTYITLLIAIFLSFLYYILIYSTSLMPTIDKIDDTKIQNAQKNISKTLEIKNIVADKNASITEVKVDENITKEIEEVVVEKELIRTLKLVPKNKIWAGYINIKTNQKYQKIFRKEFIFDTSIDWLLLFGKGTVKLEIDGEIKKYSSRENMRFKYIDGNLTKIKLKEFKSLNKGSKW